MCVTDLVRVLTVDGTGGATVVDLTGRVRTASLVALDVDGPVAPGDWLVLHTGFAVERLDPAAAAELRQGLTIATEGAQR